MHKITSGIIVLLSTMVICQSIDYAIYNPIPGYTEAPKTGSFSFKTSYLNLYSISRYYDDGGITTFKKEEDGDAEPIIYFSEVDLIMEYSINSNIVLGVTIPVILSQGLKFDNVDPDWTEWYEGMNGETGLGDIILYSSMILTKSPIYRLMGVISYKLATGSDPFDINEDAYKSTGSGQTDIGFQDLGDILLTEELLLSIGSTYLIRNKGNYSIDNYNWDGKPGNMVILNSTLSFNITDILSLGIAFTNYKSDKYKIDNESIDKSDMTGLLLSPTIGYQVNWATYDINLVGKYKLDISGKNRNRFNGFHIKTYIYI